MSERSLYAKCKVLVGKALHVPLLLGVLIGIVDAAVADCAPRLLATLRARDLADGAEGPESEAITIHYYKLL